MVPSLVVYRALALSLSLSLSLLGSSMSYVSGVQFIVIQLSCIQCFNCILSCLICSLFFLVGENHLFDFII